MFELPEAIEFYEQQQHGLGERFLTEAEKTVAAAVAVAEDGDGVDGSMFF